MNKIALIIQREYLTRVRKKSFIVMTLLGPLLIAAMYGIVFWSALSSIDQKTVEVLDDSGLFVNKFPASQTFRYEYINGGLDAAKDNFIGSDRDALVYIPANIMDDPKSVKIFAEKGVPLELQNGIERAIERQIESIKLTEAGITRSVLEDAKMNVQSETINLKGGREEKSSAGAASIIGMISAFLIYISVFIYGTQVMRGVMEEKTNRIVEVIISSVRPFQLMVGKIIGVGLVGLTQFLLWIMLSLGVFTLGSTLLKDKLQNATQQMTELQQEQMSQLPPEARQAAEQQLSKDALNSGVLSNVTDALDTLPMTTIIVCFIIYFFGGYLLYSALFGAVGSAVDSDTDTQQFMLPITIPIIASFIFAQFVMRDPNGTLAFWTSMIPFTSPIIMMVRIPFGVPFWQLALSISLLVLGFLFTTWVASRIYRIGILMYGKKVSWKELSKWIFYKG